MWSKTAVENLLSEWYTSAGDAHRGGLCSSCRTWRKTNLRVVSIHPNERGWSDPATIKLFADIRNLGWGMVIKQVKWARPGKRKVVLIPPPERGQQDMDRPDPIFHHTDLGTREPGDPELQGYNPGHPWYYLLGGRPLKVTEIEPDFDWELPSDTRLERLKDSAKKAKRLLELRDEHERQVHYAIERYEEVISPSYEVSAIDRKMGYGLETSIHLRHKHVLSSKARLAAINRELAKYQLPMVKPQQKPLCREKVLSPIPQVKEQMRLF